jgi:hypothetical protein
MTEISTPIQLLVEKATNYSTTSIQLTKLKTIRTVADVITTLITQVIIYLVMGVFILFCNLALAIWLGEILGKSYYGFLIVGLFYGLLTMIIYVFQNRWLKQPFQNIFIHKLNSKL